MADDGPFHPGERAAQKRGGSGPMIGAFGARFIRDAMPDQHRAFFAKLPFVVMGAVDPDGRPWASILCGAPGFVATPDDRRIRIGALPPEGDPIATGLAEGMPFGLLGIEPATRRRNRANGRVEAADPDGLSLFVTQSFGNCPRYIQARGFHAATDRPGTPRELGGLDAAARDAAAAADTVFVASAAHGGVDASHRGGPEGFVRVEGDTLTIPDYAGNKFFQTLGNLVENPVAGLVVPDFATGDVLSVTGRTEILWEGDRDTARYVGAERAWRVHVTRAVRLPAALPMRSDVKEDAREIAHLGRWPDGA